MPKRSQRGAKGPPKGVKCRKKGMPKMMPKFDAENEQNKCDFCSHFDSPGGRREVRRASLRRRRFADAGLFSLKRLTPAGVGGFRDPGKSKIR